MAQKSPAKDQMVCGCPGTSVRRFTSRAWTDAVLTVRATTASNANLVICIEFQSRDISVMLKSLSSFMSY